MTIVFAALGVGCYFSNRLNERAKLLGSYITLLEEAAVRMAYTSSNLAQIFSDNFAEFPFSDQTPFDEQFRAMTLQYRDVLKKEDVRLLDDFTRDLGMSDTASQQKHLRLYIDLLKEHSRQARDDMEKKSKLYRILPLSVGIAVAVLLI